jgi:hypothetical protein
MGTNCFFSSILYSRISIILEDSLYTDFIFIDLFDFYVIGPEKNLISLLYNPARCTGFSSDSLALIIVSKLFLYCS